MTSNRLNSKPPENRLSANTRASVQSGQKDRWENIGRTDSDAKARHDNQLLLVLDHAVVLVDHQYAWDEKHVLFHVQDPSH